MSKPNFNPDQVYKRNRKSIKRGIRKGAAAAARKVIYKKWRKEAEEREANRTPA